MAIKAFPHEEWIDSIDPKVLNPIRHPGMDLRDWFAGLAMQGILANEAMIDGINDNVSKWITAHAYQLADAMMKERDK